MADAEEVLQDLQLNDCFLIDLDIEDCPSAEIPLTDLYDMLTSSLLDNYRETIHLTIIQMLEDTMWINPAMMETIMNATFSMFEVRPNGQVISLRTQALQRLVSAVVAARAVPIVSIQIPILIRFKLSILELPRPPTLVVDVKVMPDPIRPADRSGPPSNVSEAEHLDQVSELPMTSPGLQGNPTVSTPVETIAIQPTTQATGSGSILRGGNFPSSVPGTNPDTMDGNDAPPLKATFRGNPVDVDFKQTSNPKTNYDNQRSYNRDNASHYDNINRHDDEDAPAGQRRDYEAYDGRSSGTTDAPNPRRGDLFDYYTSGRTPNNRTPTHSHPYVGEVSFGPESFQDYMSQFQFREVKFKDFNKIVIPKFDSSRGDSFVQWYKLLVSSCLQWGVWCPPYESVEEDNIYGAWWELLPQSVRDKESFMGHLIYTLLIKPETFPHNSKELAAVEGSSANRGFNAIYNVLRLHHPLLHSVLSMANEIPRHKRTEPFSLYLRRLQEFFARERIAKRTYTESEALDLAVRNISSEWRSEFRRLVERDKRSGNKGSLPFKLALSQIATTFMEYADEIGRDAPGSHSSPSSRSTPTAILRRIETDSGEEESPFLPEEDVDLLVRAISQNQAASNVCLGCQLPGHTLLECNRFVDYIVATSLAQRHPALRDQIANSHSHFRSRLNAANARPSTGSTTSRTVRSLQMNPESIASPSDPPFESPTLHADVADVTEQDYRQHSIQLVNDSPEDDNFESCFDTVTIRSVELLGVDIHVPISAETVVLLPEPDPQSVLLRRLAATYDDATASSYAHADNGSMANTVNDASLLFAYRPLTNPSIRLLDAGDHAHHPIGVGFLCIPTTDRGIAGAPTSVFIRTYHTPTIPGVIISHAAISKQLRTKSYFTSSHADDIGYIHFPHRLRRCQDVYINIQPTSQRGGLTFTEALILPNVEQRTAALTSSMQVFRLCSDHQRDPPLSTVADPTDGMYCQACHLPPMSDFR